MDETASFGYWLRRRRKALDLTQPELARRVGCAVITIQKIEADERQPSRQMAELLADCLAIPPVERPAFLQAARRERSAARLPLTAQPVPAPDRRPHNLPASPNPFVGRERALGEVRRLLQEARLLTLTGPGGTGKTRLALQVAGQVLIEYADGAYVVSLAAVRDAAQVAQTIADTLAVKTSDAAGPLAALKGHLHERALLLVLDNFEHLLPAAPLVGELLAAAPRLKVLATSRERLGIYGEHEFPVPPLAVPALGRPELWPVLPQVESVALFLQRAQAARPDFRLGPENAMAVAEICARLEGLPLAIELAAARIKLFTPQALLGRLDARLQTLTGGPRDAPARQQTLRDTLSWSYDLLDADEKSLFGRLAVFAGGFTLEAAEAVAGSEAASADPLPDWLGSLVNKSLVQRVEDAEGDARLMMLETIREYALERLAESGDAHALRRRHLLYYTRLAEASEPHIFGAAQIAWLNRLEQEHDNVRAALYWSLASEGEEDAALGLRLGGVLCWFWHFRGYWGEGRRWVTRLLERSPAGAASDRARALCGAGLLAWAQDDYGAAQALLEAGLALTQPSAPSITHAHALGLLGLVHVYRLELQAAEPAFAESLALFRALDARWGVAISLVRLAIVAHLRRDWARADQFNQQALALYRELENAWGISIALANMAEVALSQGDWRRAADDYREAVAIQKSTGSHWYLALTLIGVAGVAVARGQMRPAAQLLGASQALLASVSGRIPAIDRLTYDRNLATVRAHLGQAEFAAAWAEGQAMPAGAWEVVAAQVLQPEAS